MHIPLFPRIAALAAAAGLIGASTLGVGASTASAAVATTALNDNFVSGQFLPGPNNTTSGSNIGATAEVGEPQHFDGHAPQNSVWYVWTAPVTGNVIFRTDESDFDTVLAAYSGNTLTGLTRLASADDTVLPGGTVLRTSRVRFPVVAGTQYRLAVDSFSAGATGHIKLGWTTNDDFAAATVLPGPNPGQFLLGNANNLGATTEAKEPILPSGGLSSVWFSWTAPRSGTAIFTTVGNDYDTVLGVYTGAKLAKLKLVVFNDNFGSGTTSSQVTFAAVQGTTYRIVVAGLGVVDQGFSVLNYKLQ